MSAMPHDPSPILFFETVNAYQRTEAIKAAIELDLFTAISEGNETAEAVAQRCGASARGARILCDYLTIIGFLHKEDNRYSLTPDSAVFLVRTSPAYAGSILEFLLAPMFRETFQDIAGAVRHGGTVYSEGGTVSSENPVWEKFARAMMPMMAMPAQRIAEIVDPEATRKLKVLDIAAGHGLFGIAFARRNPQAEIVALDWPRVLEVAAENARQAGVAERHRTLPGSAFEVDFGTGYDVVLLTNFLHHFDPPTCEKLLRKVHDSLAPGGRVVTLEFIPHEDRVSPPLPAAFSLIMLCSTPAGDAYTFRELEEMCRRAGFSRNELHALPPSPNSVIISSE